jgi:hypothetical protein
MTTLQTLREPKATRLRSNPASENRTEADEPKESNLEWYRRWCREVNEWRRQEGLPEEDPISEEEIVAMCKEARAERYAEEQKNANNH